MVELQAKLQRLGKGEEYACHEDEGGVPTSENDGGERDPALAGLAAAKPAQRAKPDDFIEAVAQFGQILRRHAMSYLTKSTWREILSASIQDGSGEFGRTYIDLDRALIDLMATMIRDFQKRGAISVSIDEADLADCLFALQNIRFFQFISDDQIEDAHIDQRFRSDLGALRHLFA